jgi:hypothetical protein
VLKELAIGSETHVRKVAQKVLYIRKFVLSHDLFLEGCESFDLLSSEGCHPLMDKCVGSILLLSRVMSPSTIRWCQPATILEALCRVGFYIKLGPTWPASDLRLGLANGLFTKPRVVTMVPSLDNARVERQALLWRAAGSTL